MLDFIELSELLSRVQAIANASECHGFLCGQVCISGVPDDELWQEFLDVQSTDDELVYECYISINSLIMDITTYMQSTDLDFQLLLPDLDNPLEDRVDALADWCNGFLNGFGLGSNLREEAFSEDCHEILKDYSNICRAGLDDETDEEDERALAELVEYVRMSTIMIFDETYRDFHVYDLQALH
jgi:uncharacterized protein